MKEPTKFPAALLDKTLMPTAIKVALVVGSILFTINHGSAVVRGNMTRDRWISAVITYLIPYSVNIHGQSVSRFKHHSTTKAREETQQLVSSQKRG